MKKRFENKVALVTGSSKGIGAAIALKIAAEGASVVVNFTKSSNDADRVVKQIQSQGGTATAVQGDISEQADCDRLFGQCREQFGRLDILVNNAGTYLPASLGQITAENFHRQFNINVLGLILATQTAVKIMPDKSVIVNVSSIVSTLSPPHMSVYNSTKAAVDSLTRTFAKELAARNIRVNSVNPGLIATEGTKQAGLVMDSVMEIPNLGKIGLPEDIADGVVFLASDDSRWMSGQTMVMNGSPGLF
ncbi:SDR family NAD(P)-dependent oxidoreductase [Pirellulaceae bacterium SH467]